MVEPLLTFYSSSGIRKVRYLGMKIHASVLANPYMEIVSWRQPCLRISEPRSPPLYLLLTTNQTNITSGDSATLTASS